MIAIIPIGTKVKINENGSNIVWAYEFELSGKYKKKDIISQCLYESKDG